MNVEQRLRTFLDALEPGRPGARQLARGVKKLDRRSNTARTEVSPAYKACISADLENQSASAISVKPLAPELA